MRSGFLRNNSSRLYSVAVSEMTCSPKVTRPESISKQRFPQVNVKDECLAVPPAESATLRRNKVRILS